MNVLRHKLRFIVSDLFQRFTTLLVTPTNNTGVAEKNMYIIILYIYTIINYVYIYGLYVYSKGLVNNRIYHCFLITMTCQKPSGSFMDRCQARLRACIQEIEARGAEKPDKIDI